MITGENLAQLLPHSRADTIRRYLVAWRLHLFESMCDATAV